MSAGSDVRFSPLKKVPRELALRKKPISGFRKVFRRVCAVDFPRIGVPVGKKRMKTAK